MKKLESILKLGEEFEITTGKRYGKCREQSIRNTYKLLNYIESLEGNKLYGIMKGSKGVTLLTETEVILKTKIENKIQELNKQYEEMGSGSLLREILTYKIEVLKELLEED